MPTSAARRVDANFIGGLRGLFFKEGNESDAANVSDASRRQHDGCGAVSRGLQQQRIQLSSPGSTGRSSIPERAMVNPGAAAYWMPRLAPTQKLRRPWTSTPAKPWRSRVAGQDKRSLALPAPRHHDSAPVLPDGATIIWLFPKPKKTQCFRRMVLCIGLFSRLLLEALPTCRYALRAPPSIRGDPMPIQHFAPPPHVKAPPLSFATRVGDLLFVSGIPGFDAMARCPTASRRSSPTSPSTSSACWRRPARDPRSRQGQRAAHARLRRRRDERTLCRRVRPAAHPRAPPASYRPCPIRKC